MKGQLESQRESWFRFGIDSDDPNNTTPLEAAGPTPPPKPGGPGINETPAMSAFVVLDVRG
jgi:hypothetical protein